MKLKKLIIVYSETGKKKKIVIPFEESGIAEQSYSRLRVKTEKIKSDSGTVLTVDLAADEAVVIHDLFIEAEYGFTDNDKIFCNGYQSWTSSDEYPVNARIRDVSPFLKILGGHHISDAHIRKYPVLFAKGRLHGYTYAYIRKTPGTVDFIGEKNEWNGYTVFEFNTRADRIEIRKDCEGHEINGTFRAFELFIMSGDEGTVFEAYWKFRNIEESGYPCITGWTSWYNYFTDISEEIILDNLMAVSEKKIPIDIFQIDDGFNPALGDWLETNERFPRGMRPVSDEIHDKGYKAGLWLAPFVCEKKSEIYRKHYDWILKDKHGNPVIAGYNPTWSGKYFSLDIYNSRVREYLREVFDRVLNEWNFDMVKLDFLFAAAVYPRRDRTRGQIMRDAMRFLRELAGDKIILGCGVPLDASAGLVEYCRIGSDVGLGWEHKLYKLLQIRERPSTINSLISTIARRHMSGRFFLNDPDVFILRDENTSLNEHEKYTLFLINNIFGALIFTSDNIRNYNEGQLFMYRSMFPLRRKEVKQVVSEKQYYDIAFSIDEKSYRAFCNLSDTEKPVKLPEGAFYFYIKDRPEGTFAAGGSGIVLSPHESVCALVIDNNGVSLAGSTGHLFPGADLTVKSVSESSIIIDKERKSLNSSTVYFVVPGPGSFMINGTSVEASPVSEGLYIVSLAI